LINRELRSCTARKISLDTTALSAAQPGASPRTTAGPLLTFNYLPVRFEDVTFEAGTRPYESSEQLDALRRRLADTHVVVRFKDTNLIVCVPFVTGAEQVGTPQTFKAGGAEGFLTAHLLEAALVRVLTTWTPPFLLSAFPPRSPTFVLRSPSRDLMAPVVQGVDGLEGLHVYPEYCLDVRRTGPADQAGIVVGIKCRYEIEWTVSELLRRGVDVLGKYVLTVADAAPLLGFVDPISRRKLCGVVEAVEGGVLKVAGESELVDVAADQAWLEASKTYLDDVLAAAAGSAQDRVVKQLEREAFKLTGAAGRMTNTQRFADWLIGGGPLTIANGVKATVGPPTGGSRSELRVTGRQLTEPTFVFDLGGGKTSPYPDHGLNNFGPYDSESFTPKTPHVLVIAPRQFQGRVETFIREFRDGTSATAFAKGFVRKYQLTGCDVTFQFFDGDVRDARAYRQACIEALEVERRAHLAVVFVSEQQRRLNGDASPYLVAKSVLMSQGVPVQMFRLEKLDRPDLAHLLNTMAVACYAKLTGTPYVAKVVARPMAQELVIGIGGAHVRQHRMGRRERYVGITTVFTSDGHYRVSNVSKEASYEDYPQELMRAIQACIEDVKARNGWQFQDRIRLVFHVFKPLKDRETHAVKKLVEGLTREYAGVEFAFLHISEDHNWMMYDRASTGVGNGAAQKGRYVPACGYAVPISRSEMLIATVGPRELKVPLQGAPRPLLIKLHRESTFQDLDYLAEQVFRFTALSWRRLYPSGQPVTTAYSKLIAGLLGQLRHVRNWNSDIISTKLRDSRWFL
jgi:Piwi domain